MDVSSQNGAAANNSSDFVRKLYKMLEDPSYSQVVRWGDEGDSFVVLENERFTKHILPKHFKHSNFASFVRQLNKYDFHKVRHNNEETGQSPYGAGAWEFKHPEFKANNKDALDNIRRKAPAPRKQQSSISETGLPGQQIDLVNQQLVATQQQLRHLEERYNELSMHHSMLLQELIGVQKTVVNHEHVMQNVISFLHTVDAKNRRDSKAGGPFANHPENNIMQNNTAMSQGQNQDMEEDDSPASPLANASKLLSDSNADAQLNFKNLEHMNELHHRTLSLTTPPPDMRAKRGPGSTASSGSLSYAQLHDLDNMVYPVGQNNGIDPMYSEHLPNIPYPMPSENKSNPRAQFAESRKKSAPMDPGWIRPPQILLVEDDATCRRIGSKFLYSFKCSIDNAFDGLEAVNKVNAGSRYDLILMDIIMPNLDGVSACHLIRQIDTTPIVAMTSNIRSDDISMYFSHGMDDVLPKPFTKEGLLNMLEKHLPHLKRNADGTAGAPEAMGPPQSASSVSHRSAAQSLKDENSPVASPSSTITSSWNSPAQFMPPSSATSANFPAQQLQGGPMASHAQPGFAHNPMGAPMSMPPGGQPISGHRRQVSDISGGPDDPNDPKRQRMYPHPHPHQQQQQQQQQPHHAIHPQQRGITSRQIPLQAQLAQMGRGPNG